MPKEIEYKFLIHPERLPALGPGRTFIQGYICPRPTVRVRISTSGTTSIAYLTIKGPGLIERDEFEYEIPVDHARQMLPLCGKAVLEKIRYVHNGWEIDEFLGRHKGLWLAEYELHSADAKLPPLPDWIKEDVTGRTEYSNSTLALQP
ncbi:MAG: CYTH domain-containing protein [Planctomycetota bacterium]